MMVDFDWAQAEARFRRAIELKPSYAVAHWQYGWLLVSLGRQDAALREFQRATALEPLSAVMAVDTNVPYSLTGQYDRAIAQCRKGLELDPNFWLAHFVLGWIELEKGTNVPNAIAEYRLAMVEPVPFVKGWLGYAYGRNGQKDEARKVLAELDRLSTERFVSPFCQALIYLGLGEHSKAIDWLEKAYEGRSQWLTWLKVEPLLDPLRPDPRFQALVKRMNFPP
jgi:serine/threonine-protein kinase